MLNLLSLLLIAFGGEYSVASVERRIDTVIDMFDLPRPWLEQRAYMEKVYAQALKVGATNQQIKRLRHTAYLESRGNPRVCVVNGCGPFQQTIHPLLPKVLYKTKTALFRNTIRWLLTNKPGYAASTAFDLLRRCEILTGEHWRCCYVGAYRPVCRVKWDKKYREEHQNTSLSTDNNTPFYSNSL